MTPSLNTSWMDAPARNRLRVGISRSPIPPRLIPSRPTLVFVNRGRNDLYASMPLLGQTSRRHPIQLEGKQYLSGVEANKKRR